MHVGAEPGDLARELLLPSAQGFDLLTKRRVLPFELRDALGVATVDLLELLFTEDRRLFLRNRLLGGLYVRLERLDLGVLELLLTSRRGLDLGCRLWRAIPRPRWTRHGLR